MKMLETQPTECEFKARRPKLEAMRARGEILGEEQQASSPAARWSGRALEASLAASGVARSINYVTKIV